VQTLVVQLVAILTAFLLGFALVGIFGFDPFEVYGVLWSGSLGSIENVGWSLQNMTPLVFTGLAVALSFRAGLFNIGAEGQLVAGAFCAAVVGWAVPALAETPALSNHGFWIAHWYPKGSRVLMAVLVLGLIRLLHRTFDEDDTPLAVPAARLWKRYGIGFGVLVLAYFSIPPSSSALFTIANALVFPLALLAAMAGGAAWAFLPAYLRAKLGVSEVINTIMFNFLASFLASWLLTTPLFKAPGAIPQTPAVGARAELSELAKFVPVESVSRELGSSQLNTGFLLALIAAGLVAVLLTRTTLGYELRALGSNATAAAAQGIPVERNVVLAMLLSGALAGLGGAEQVLGVHHHFVKDFWTGLGFTGIAVALVGRNHPAGVVLAALLFGALQNGAVEIDMMTLFPRELILVLQALIIFLVASGPVLADLLGRKRSS
jgi:ABC-type uncharacterized transport system permease subunit